MRFIFVMILCLLFSVPLTWGYSTDSGLIRDSDGNKVNLYGVNWFGFETNDHVVHGLWARNWKDMISQIKGLGFTAIRLPFCPQTLNNINPTSINYSKNPDLVGLGSLDIMDQVISELDREGFYILLDHHTSDCQTIEELWYTSNYTEQDWIDDLVFIASRYQGIKGFLGIDIKNEPHGPATWGVGNHATDWNSAAERAASEILAVNPNILIFVQGIESNPVCSGTVNHWWGGNLEPFSCFPLNIPEDKLVLSPHVYGPDVYEQPYFSDPDFPNNMPGIWEQHFGYLVQEGQAVVPGEFGGRYGHGGDPNDKVWQDALIDYFLSKGITNFFYWSWNPNSGDTGGILKDNWQDVWQDKVGLLARLINGSTTPPAGPACSDSLDNDNDGFVDYPDDPGCNSADDNDETDSPKQGNQLSTKLVISDDWGTGYCADVTVSNTGSEDEDWVVSFTIEGTVKDLWNATYSQAGDLITAQGVSWNNIVNAGSTVTFGFCANRKAPLPTPTPIPTPVSTPTPVPTPIPTPPPVVFACSDGLDNDGDALIDYPADPGCDNADDSDEYNVPSGADDLSIELIITNDWGRGYCADVFVYNNTSTNIDWVVTFDAEGSIRNIWNAVYEQSGEQVIARGASWNNIVNAGSHTTFGYCAIR